MLGVPASRSGRTQVGRDGRGRVECACGAGERSSVYEFAPAGDQPPLFGDGRAAAGIAKIIRS